MVKEERGQRKLDGGSERRGKERFKGHKMKKTMVEAFK